MALSESQMAMWETIVALVHADGETHAEEERFLRERFEKLPATQQQKQELLKHLANPESPKEIFKRITEPRDRSQVIYFARLLFCSDNDFHAEERKILDQLHSEVMAKVDFNKVMHEMDAIIVEYKQKEQSFKDAQPLHRKVLNALVFWVDLDQVK